MRGFARQHEVAFQVAVEGNAIAQQIGDARRGLPGNEMGDVGIDDAGTGMDGVGSVVFGRIGLADGGGNTALRPDARGAFAQRCGSDDRDRKRCQA